MKGVCDRRRGEPRESGTELELTIDHDRDEPYTHGDGYGHIAMVVDDLEAEHKRHAELGYDATAIKELFQDGALMAKFFFVQDPDGYKIEVLQRYGRYRQPPRRPYTR